MAVSAECSGCLLYYSRPLCSCARSRGPPGVGGERVLSPRGRTSRRLATASEVRPPISPPSSPSLVFVRLAPCVCSVSAVRVTEGGER